jgi:hypothetical protein
MNFIPERRTSMTALEVLKAAYHLLDDKRRWTTHDLARNSSGDGCNTDSPEAVQWCAIGAIEWVEGRGVGWSKAQHDASAALHASLPGDEYSVVAVNNGPDGYELIRAAFRKAIASLEPKLVRDEAPQKEKSHPVAV